MSEYAETVKTEDSMGSTMRYSTHSTQHGVNMKPFPNQPLITNHSRVKDKYPAAKKRYKDQEIRLEGGSESHTTV